MFSFKQIIASNSFLVLIIVLGGITITTVVAQTSVIPQTTTTITYPYVLTDGTNQRLLIASNGNIAIGKVVSNPPSLLSVRQLVDTNLGGIIVQNNGGNSSLRFWVDNQKTGYITAGTTQINLLANGAIGIPIGNVGIGTASPTQKLDVRGNVALTGNMTATPGKIFKISTTNGKDICIGAC